MAPVFNWNSQSSSALSFVCVAVTELEPYKDSMHDLGPGKNLTSQQIQREKQAKYVVAEKITELTFLYSIWEAMPSPLADGSTMADVVKTFCLWSASLRKSGSWTGNALLVILYEDVCGLDVAMNNMVFVQTVHGLQELRLMNPLLNLLGHFGFPGFVVNAKTLGFAVSVALACLGWHVEI